MRGFSTFRSRVFWSVIPILLGLSVLYAILDLRERQGLAESEFLKRGRAMVANLADTSKLAVYAEDQRLLASSIQGVVGDPDVAYVVVYDGNAKVLAAAGRQLDEFPDYAQGLPAEQAAAVFRDGKAWTNRAQGAEGNYAEFLIPIVSQRTGLADEALIGPLGSSTPSPADKPQIIGAVKMSLSLKSVQEHASELVRVWISVTAAFLVFSTVVIYDLSRRITAPIKRLTAQARKIAQGFLDQKIAVESRDEVGQLAASFNEMAVALQANIAEKERVLGELQELNRTQEQRIHERTAEIEQRTDELQRSLQEVRALGAVSQAVSSSLDLPQVLETIARYAVELADAHACGIFEFDTERGVFEVVGSYSLTDAFIEDFAAIRIDPQRAMAMQSSPLAQPVQIADLALSQQFPLSMVPLHHGYRSLLIVPMEHETSTRALVLLRRTTGAFDERVLSLLTALANQSRVAIDNARLFREVQSQRVKLEQLSRNQQQLYRLSTSIQEPLSLKDQLGMVLEAAREVVEIDRLCIWVARGDILEALTGAGLEREIGPTEGSRIPLNEAGAMRTVFSEGVALLFDGQHPVPAELRLRPPYSDISMIRSAAFLVVPMIARGHSIGVLTADNKWSRNTIQPHTSELLHIFASHAAVAIENARLFHELDDRGHQLEIASRHKSQFLANMSHELRTPLNAVLGYIELILDNIMGEVPAEIRDSLERAQRSGHHLLSLINDILDLSKIEAGQLSLSVGEYSIAEVVDAVISSMQPLAAEKRLMLKTRLPDELPDGRGDVRRITQVLMNLVGNAIKFTETGEVRIEVGASGAGFLVSVIDTGPGIATADQQRIFEEFQQVDNSSTRKKGGTGLGLSIAKRIVELHGGNIGLHSSTGKGSTFWFTLPVEITERTEAA